MLESARRLTLDPASNLPDGPDSTWFHLLPSLELDTIVCVGVPHEAVQRLLSEHARRVITVDQPTRATPFEPVADCDLLLIAEWSPRDLAATISALAPAVGRVGTIVLIEPRAGWGRVGPRLGRTTVQQLERLIDPADGWFLIRSRPVGGSRTIKRIRRARRLATARIASRFGFESAGAVKHASDLVEYRPVSFDGARMVARGTVTGSTTPPGRLPRYLREIGLRHDLDLDDPEWSYGPARGYRSQKIVFVAKDRRDGERIIVKSTQETRFNDRLAAEAEALTRLHDAPVGDVLATPGVRFIANHSGLLLVAEDWLDGEPFRQVALPDPAAIHFRLGVDALVDLAAATARPTSPDELDAAVTTLIGSYVDVFSPPPPVAASISEIGERLCNVSLPSVLQHGDFGIWNLLASPSGGPVGVLDWENADPAGMPLWDLFVFARTFGIFMADSTGIRYGPAVFHRQLLSPSPLREALSEATRRYCATLSIPETAATDLFSLCWMQQALREAATLPEPSWETSRNGRYLERCLDTPFRPSDMGAAG